MISFLIVFFLPEKNQTVLLKTDFEKYKPKAAE